MITNINDLYSLIKRQNEIIKRVKNGGLSIEAALSGTQGILDGDYPFIKDKFAQFTHLLRPLEGQAVELRKLNKQMPKKMQVPDAWFDDLDTISEHVQLIEDLEFFFIVPLGTLKEVIEYQLKLMELTQPGIWRSSDFRDETKGAYLDETADKRMFEQCGIFRRRINLVSYWDPKNGRSVDQARQHASDNGILLAGLAAIGAYAAQEPELYQSQDGEKLPYFDIADLRSGDGCSYAFYSGWNSGKREVCFRSYRSDNVDRHCAGPSFI